MKRQKWLTGILAVMLVASFLLAAISLVTATTVNAAPPPPQPDYQGPQQLGTLVHGLRELLWLLGCRGSDQAALCQQRL